jgi:hypothetical protein
MCFGAHDTSEPALPKRCFGVHDTSEPWDQRRDKRCPFASCATLKWYCKTWQWSVAGHGVYSATTSAPGRGTSDDQRRLIVVVPC